MSAAPSFNSSIARTYHDVLGPLIFEAYARDLARRLSPRAGGRVLELACGTGIVTREIAASMPAGTGWSLLATDLNPGMLEVAKGVVPPGAPVTFQVVDACKLPFADREFDTIVCQYGLMFFPDKVGSMREARRVLKPGGRYIFNVWDSLAHNPMARVVHEQLGAIFPDNPPPFMATLPFGWSDRAEIERTVRAGGFEHCELETVSFECQSPTAADAARAWLEGTPNLAALAERGIKDPAPVRERVAAALTAKFGGSPCRSTMQAVVATAW